MRIEKDGKYIKAIEDWEDDLYYLHVDYYRGRFGFKWPQTTI